MPTPYPILPGRALLELGERFATARRVRRLTQADLAGLAGVGISTIASLEGGHPGVSVGNVLKVLDALDLLADVGEWLRAERDPEIIHFAKSKLRQS
jgi:transcriptional regulator with XRE-family HTH domain